MRNSILAAAFLTTVSCATRAPSSFELDKKAGLSPSLDAEDTKKEAKELRKTDEKKSDVKEKKNKVNDEDKPRRTFPRIEKIWVYGRELSPAAYMQGTHIFLEVTPSTWTSEEGAVQ